MADQWNNQKINKNTHYKFYINYGWRRWFISKAEDDQYDVFGIDRSIGT